MTHTYIIEPAQPAHRLESDWDNSCWKHCPTLELTCHQGESPSHRPGVQARLGYDARRLYGIFRVEDDYVRAVATNLHGEVWKDSCVEFFFTPSAAPSTSYFNLEMNCCGVMLLQHQTAPRTDKRFLRPEQCSLVQVVSSLSGPIRQELTGGLIWTVAFSLPFDILTAYEKIDIPAPGVCWRGNLYKCADDSSHPHWLTWSPIKTDKPDFHRPDGFGRLLFV